MEDDVEKQSRILLRPWLENMLSSGKIHGLVWHDPEKTMFQVPWKHRSKKDWSIEHCSVFVEWAKNTGRWSDDTETPNFAQLKTRLRCAFNKAPDIEEMKDFHCNHGEEPYKVYRFKARKDVSLRKTRHKASAPNPSSHSLKISTEGENWRNFESVQDGNLFVDEGDSNKDVLHGISFIGVKNEENNVSSVRSDIAISASNTFHIKTQHDADPWASEVRSKLEFNEAAINTPVIPLSVELFGASSSDSCDSERDSPTDLSTYELPDELPITSFKDLTNTGHHHQVVSDISSPEQEFESDKILFRKSTSVLNKKDSSPASSAREVFLQQLPPKEHMLQVASLFVEAGEKITQQVSGSLASMVPLQNTDATEYQNFIVVAPNNCEEEHVDAVRFRKPQSLISLSRLHHGSEKSFYNGDAESAQKTFYEGASKNSMKPDELSQHGADVVDLTCKSYQQICDEPIDLTKKAIATQFRPKCNQSRQVCSESWKQNDEETSNKEIINIVLHDIDSEDLNFLPTDTIEDIRMKAKCGEQMLVSKAKLLCQWEDRLKRWEAELKATEAACYWKNKFLDIELANKSLFINDNHQQLSYQSINNQQGSTHMLKESPKELTSRLMLPGKGYQRSGFELQHLPAIQVIPETVQNLSENTVSGVVSTKQLNNRFSILPKAVSMQANDHVGLFSRAIEQPSNRKRGSVKADNSLSGTNRTSGLQQKDLPIFCSPNQTNLSQFVFPDQRPLVVLPSVVRTVNDDSRLLCSEAAGVCKEVTTIETSAGKPLATSDDEIQECGRILSQVTSDQSLQSSSASVGLVPVVAVSDSAVDASPPDVPLSDSNERPSSDGFQKMQTTCVPSVTEIRNSHDSDCDSSLVIQMSDDEEEEENGEAAINQSGSTISECSDQEISENEELQNCTELTTEMDIPLIQNRISPLLVDAGPPEPGSPQSKHRLSFNSDSKIFETSLDSGTRSHGRHSLEEFTEWLRKKTETICDKDSNSTATDVIVTKVSDDDEKSCIRNSSSMTRKRSHTQEQEGYDVDCTAQKIQYINQ